VDTKTKINISSNLVGNIINALFGIVFVPIYIRYIGSEGYGLIGLFGTIQSALYLLDMGISTTLNRELAQYSIDVKANATQIINTTRTYEVAFWGLSCLGLVVGIVISYFFTHYWINPHQYPKNDIFYYFILLSISFALFLPKGFYAGGLLGLQHHLAMNAVNIIGSCLKYIGAIAVLVFIEASPRAFFMWQAIASLLQTLLMAVVLWYYLPNGFLKAQFDVKILRGSRQFALGITGISLTAIILTQVDKIILSRLLTLEQFGYYSFAAVIGFGLFQVIAPISQTYFPKISQFYTNHETAALTYTYHQASKVMAIALFPIAAIIAFFSKPILEVWTHNAQLVENCYLIVAVMTIGTALNGLVNVPYMLALAAGKPSLVVKTNIVMIVLLVPLIVLGANMYGGLGACSMWLLLNVLYLFSFVNIVHNRFLSKENSRWFLNDILPIFGVSFLISGCAAFFLNDYITTRFSIVLIGLVFGIIALICMRIVFPHLKIFRLPPLSI
jgi:O-antigen/teichoic acid export membrane protein